MKIIAVAILFTALGHVQDVRYRQHTDMGECLREVEQINKKSNGYVQARCYIVGKDNNE